MSNDLTIDIKSPIPAQEQALAVTPGDMLRAAISANLGVEGIKALAEIYEGEQARQAERAFNSALAAFQSEMHTVAKSKKADRYQYAPLDAIMVETRPVLERNGFSYSFDSKLSDHGVEVVFILRHAAGHSTRTTFSAPVDAELRVNETQKVGAALSYGKRYAMTAGLGIAIGERDTDARNLAVPLTPEEAADLAALIDDVKPDLPKFCKFFGVEKPEELPRHRYQEACQMLRNRARAKG